MLRTAIVLLALTVPAAAQPIYLSPRPLETIDEAWRRQESNRYQQDRAFGGQPLGGYQQRLGDPPVQPPPASGLWAPPPAQGGLYPSPSRPGWR
jgi:hypothetical protein